MTKGNGCSVEWVCDFEQWKDYCEEKMKISYSVLPGFGFQWSIAYVTLGFYIIGEIRNHTKHFNETPIFYKILLLE